MKFIPLIIGIILITVPLYLFFRRDKTNISEVIIGGKKIRVELADTVYKRQKGLMGRVSLPEDQGMLFVFPSNSIHSFWMKNTLINLDILWISEDGKVVEIWENAPSDNGTPARYTPKAKSKYVLEVNGGYVKNNEIKVGDIIRMD